MEKRTYAKTGKNQLVLSVVMDSDEPLTAREITAKAGLYPEEIPTVTTILLGYQRKQMISVADKKLCPATNYMVKTYRIKTP